MEPTDRDRAAAIWRWHVILPSAALMLVAVIYLPVGVLFGMDVWFRVVGLALMVIGAGWVVPGAWRLRSTLTRDPVAHPLQVVWGATWPFVGLCAVIWGGLAGV